MPEAIPDYMRAESRRATRWNTLVGFSTFTLFLLSLTALAYVATIARHPLSLNTFASLERYVATAWPNPFAHYLYLLHGAQPALELRDTIVYTLLLFVAFGATSAVLVLLNPHRSVYMIHGDARFANHRDVQRMTAAGQIGWNGLHLHLGSFAGRIIQLIETLSTLILAPPGTGKTARLLVPSALISDKSCLVIHDPKPELSEICSGWRARLGPTYILNWAATDDPVNGIYHPSFNFLDPQILPGPGAARDTFVDNLTKTLIPDDKGKGDPYFVPRGRAALSGFLLYMISHLHDTEGEQKERNYDDLPPEWRGMDVSFPMLIDWITRTQLNAISSAGDGGGKNEDPLGPYFRSLVDTAIKRQYPERVVRELQPLIATAPQERSGILGQMTKGLNPFSNSAAAQRTSRSDFVPADLSGRLKSSTLLKLGYDPGFYPKTRDDWDAIRPFLTPDDWDPVTVFVSIAQQDAAAFENLTTLLFETISLELLSYGPNETKPNGTLMGPYPTGFLIDEVPKMATCNAIIEGPNVGRSKKRYYMLICQTADQLKERYSENHMNTILASCAAQVALQQNDPNTVDRLARTVGDTTIKRKSVSRNVGFSKSANPFAGNMSETIERAKLLNTSNLTSMPIGEHLLIIQGFVNRPIWCKSAPYFSDPLMVKRAFNPRTATGVPPAPPIPPAEAEILYLRDRAKRAAERSDKNLAERERALEIWRYEQAFMPDGATAPHIP